MKKLAAIWLSLLVLMPFATGSSMAGDQEAVQSLLNARSAVKAVPVPSAHLKEMTLAKGYELQKDLAKALAKQGEVVSGFKAALTSEAGQKQFGADQPLMAPLFKSGELAPDATVNTKQFIRLFMETEIGYVAGQRIDKPVSDVEALKKMISQVFPAVELPDIRFEDIKQCKAADLAADAVGSAQYIVGNKIPADKVEVGAVEVSLTHDGGPVNKGKAADVMGDQWKALLWLVNTAISRGWVIEPGQIFITGAMGRMIPGKPGKYEGDWGPLGKMSWTVN